MQTALSMSLRAEAARSIGEAAVGALGTSLRSPDTSPSGDIPRELVARASPDDPPGIRVRFRPGSQAKKAGCKVTPAILGNHIAIQKFLQRQLHQPSTFEFASLANRPGYDASQRLLIQGASDRELLAHVHLQPQLMRFGCSEIPTARLQHFAIVSTLKRRGYADHLLMAAESEARRSGALLCVARGIDHAMLSKHGWVSIGHDPISIVSPRRLLGQLPVPQQPESLFYAAKLPEYFVRIGRLTDLETMQDLYQNHVSSGFGTVIRGREYWSWLMTRGSHHRVYLFCEDDVPRAYVVVRNASVLEIVDSTNDGRGAARLLSQVGADAIDQGRFSLRIHSPVNDLVHRWADQADGGMYVGDREDAWMIKVPSVRALLRRLAPQLFRNQRKQDVVPELSLRIGSEEIRIARGVRSMKITRGAAKRHRVGMTQKAAARLMLGYRSADQLAAEQQLVASTPEAMRSIRILFPAQDLWRPEWDEATVLRT